MAALLERLRLQRHVGVELVGLATLTTVCPASLALSGRTADLPTAEVGATAYYCAALAVATALGRP